MRGRDVERATGRVVLVVLAVCLGLSVMAWDAYALRLIWRWHVAPTCGVHALTFFHALGVLMMVRLLLRVDSKVDGGRVTLEGVVTWALGRMASAGALVLVAYAAWLWGGGGNG